VFNLLNIQEESGILCGLYVSRFNITSLEDFQSILGIFIRRMTYISCVDSEIIEKINDIPTTFVLTIKF
jgi:hypothetical protein